MRKLTLIIFTVFLLLLPITNYRLLITDAYAAVPRLINYQGKLTDSAGKPLTGAYNVTFRIYDVESGGSPLWTESYTGLSIDKGIFNVMLGGQTTLNLAFDKQYYLSIQIGSDHEMAPRQRFASSAYAIRASVADEAIQAQNANKVANVEVSTTPAANKILPLDSTGKFPVSTLGLKVYDSGWFPIGANSNITLNHNLGTEKVIVQCLAAVSNNGSGTHYLVQPYDDHRAGGDRDGLRLTITSSQITLFTASVGLVVRDDGGGSEYYMRSARILMLALE